MDIDDELARLRESNTALEVKLAASRVALDALLIHAIEFSKDWRKGDFMLPELAELDMQSLEAQFDLAKKALVL